MIFASEPRKEKTKSICDDEPPSTVPDQKVKINVRFSDVNSASGFKSEKSTAANSDALTFSNSHKTTSKELASSPCSALALRNLGKSLDSDEEDDLARLLDDAGENEDDEFELIADPCNGFANQQPGIQKAEPFNAASNYGKQNPFALCSSEAVSKGQTRPAPLICVGLTEKQ